LGLSGQVDYVAFSHLFMGLSYWKYKVLGHQSLLILDHGHEFIECPLFSCGRLLIRILDPALLSPFDVPHHLELGQPNDSHHQLGMLSLVCVEVPSYSGLQAYRPCGVYFIVT